MTTPPTRSRHKLAIVVAGGPARASTASSARPPSARASRRSRSWAYTTASSGSCEGDTSHVARSQSRTPAASTSAEAPSSASRARTPRRTRGHRHRPGHPREAGRGHAADDRRRRHGVHRARAGAGRGGRLRVAHVPKTIDNDLDLPADVWTFGYQTARGGRRHRPQPHGRRQDDRALVLRRRHGPEGRPPRARHRQGRGRDALAHPRGVRGPAVRLSTSWTRSPDPS